MKAEFAAILLMLIGCMAAAPATAPAPALDSPQAVQRAYRQALNAQDARAAVELFTVRTPGERATAEVFVANDLAAARLAAAAVKAFDVPLVGGGTLLPALETDAWTIEGDVALLRERNSPRPAAPPLRRVGGAYKIDLVAWGLNWMDDAAEGDEARARHAVTRADLDATRKQVDDGFYRTLEEVLDAAYGLDQVLSPPPGNATQPKPPRAFRRPVKLDLSSPAAAYHSAVLAKAEGDGEAWLRCHAIVDRADEPALKAYARFITGTADLEEAAVAKFGAAGARVGLPVPIPLPRTDALNELRELNDPDTALTVKGDEATWGDPEQPAHEAVRVDGQWKLRSRPKAMVGQREDEEGTDWPRIFDMAADLQAKFSREIAGGAYKSVDEVRRAMGEAVKSPGKGPA